ncbi:MAG: WGR domain-containing protein [Polyangiaceae bacterium]|nr:WGR domain-containing protein [Polyangiaceae bacterium]
MAAKRRFELIDGSSNKFWETWCVGREVHTQYGKIGSTGQTTVKKEADAAAATKLLGKLIAEKTRKGYLEVRSVGGASAKPAAKADTKTKTAKAPAAAPAAKTAKPAAKTAKAAVKPEKATAKLVKEPSVSVTDGPHATPLDLVELMIEQLAKHKRVSDDELEILANYAASAPQKAVLGWLKSVPKNDGWRCAGAARIAIGLFYAGEIERAKELLAEAREQTPKESPKHWEEHYGVTHAHVSLAAAELLLDPAAGKARIARLRDIKGSNDEHAALIVSTLLIGRQWPAVEDAAKAIQEFDYGFSSYFQYALSCALRCEQHDLVGKLLKQFHSDDSHERAASTVYEHTLRWQRPQDSLELCVRFPEVFTKQYVLDALVDFALVDAAKAASYAERISNLKPNDDINSDIVLGCALYRFRNDPQGGSQYLKARTEKEIQHKAFAPLRDAISGKVTPSNYDTVDMGRFRWTKELVAPALLPEGKLNGYKLREALPKVHELVRIGAADTARGLLPKLMDAFESTPKGDRSTTGDYLAYLAGMLRDAKLGDTISKLVMPSIRVKVLNQVVAGALEVGDWDIALSIAEKTPDADLNDRQRMLRSALSGRQWHKRHFCLIP